MPCEDCCFGAPEGVGMTYCEFSSEQFCGTRENLALSVQFDEMWRIY